MRPHRSFTVCADPASDPQHSYIRMSNAHSERGWSWKPPSVDADDRVLRSCMQDIVGARFHCAICDSVDICANCESAGLPGNLTSADGGHDYSHIMIKVRPGHVPGRL